MIKNVESGRKYYIEVDITDDLSMTYLNNEDEKITTVNLL